MHTARQDAENARREIERQAWQTSGLAQLGDVVSGDQKPSFLAESIIQFLCHYLDAQVGALFLLEDTHLRLVGCYACAEMPQLEFDLGEGIIGLAVQGKKTISLTEIPPDAVRLSTGFGEILPSQVVVVPFFFDQELVGVFEIATVTQFTDEHLTFLESAAERIGITFHTALARRKINRLLKKTNQQAEKLQHSDEELRALSEELQAQIDQLGAK